MKKIIPLFLLSFLFCKNSLSQNPNGFLEVTIDFSDTTVLKKNYLIEDYTTVYVYFEDSKFSFSPLTGENLSSLITLEEKIIDRIEVNNVDTLLIWGLQGEFKCYEFIKNSLKKVNNLFVFSYGEINFHPEYVKNQVEQSSISLNNIRLEGYGINIDLDLFDSEFQVKELDIACGNENLIIKNKSNQLEKVFIEGLNISKLKWWLYKRKFENAMVEKKVREFVFRRGSKLNRINLQQNNFKKL